MKHRLPEYSLRFIRAKVRRFGTGGLTRYQRRLWRRAGGSYVQHPGPNRLDWLVLVSHGQIELEAATAKELHDRYVRAA